MKVALNTVDLFPGRERLMPFRIVVEVAKEMMAHGIKAHVVNTAVSEENPKDYEYEGVKIMQAPRDFNALSDFVNANGYDYFFFAAAFRDGLKDLSGLAKIGCRKMVYIGSGINPKVNALKLFQSKGFGEARAFLLEAFTPKSMLDNKLVRAGFTDVVGLTGLTALQFSKLKGHTIYAGKDNFENVVADYSVLEKNDLKEKKFVLFTGAPAPTRGAEILLNAIGKAVKSVPDLKVVFLMRTDVGSKYTDFMNAVENSQHKNNFVVLTEMLNVPHLKAFMESAWSLVLPFVCIPSEIPITYYEALSVGTPIISFKNGGTTEYLAEGLLNAGTPSVSNLANAVAKMWNDDTLRNKLATQGKNLMNSHPTWQQVGEQWIELLK